MRYLNSKDARRRRLFSKVETRWVLLRSLFHNQSVSFPFRQFLYEKFLHFPPNSSPTRIRNRCVVTGRAGSVLRRFRLSRITFRELALAGKLTGISKSSW